MARPKRAGKIPSRKNIKPAVTVPAADDTMDVAGTAAASDGPKVQSRSTKRPQSRAHTPSSDEKYTAVAATKSRADSMSAMELSDMAAKQLLGELEATLTHLDIQLQGEARD